MKGERNGLLVFLVGASGSGKSVIGGKVTRNNTWNLIDTDAEILNDTGKDTISAIFEEFGESYFRELEVQYIKNLNATNKTLIVSTGGGLPANPGLMACMNEMGFTVYLKASIETLWHRISTDPLHLDNRPILKNGGIKKLEDLIKKREKYYQEATITLDTEQLSVREVCDLLSCQVKLLNENTIKFDIE